jgi:hypothetical protein
VPIGRTDTITGGNGIDQLTGGAGADVFNYAAIVAAANADNITAFVTAQDFFNFTAATYGGTFADGAGDVDTILTNAAATALVGGAAGAADDSLIQATAAQILAIDLGTGAVASGAMLAYATDSGALYYDADGDFTAGAVVIGTVTTLTGTLATTNFVGVWSPNQTNFNLRLVQKFFNRPSGRFFIALSTAQNTAVTPTTFALGFLATAASFASLQSLAATTSQKTLPATYRVTLHLMATGGCDRLQWLYVQLIFLPLSTIS